MKLLFVLALGLLIAPGQTFSKDIKQIINDRDVACYGGDFLLTSTHFTIEQNYSEFKEKNPKCMHSNVYEKHGVEFSDRRQAVEEYIDTIIENQKCDFLRPLLNLFRQSREETYDYIDSVQSPRMKMLKDYIKNLRSDINLKQAAIARNVNFCGHSDFGIKIYPYWYLTTKLKELLHNMTLMIPPPKEEMITKTGQEAKTCNNVKASGSEDLDNFFVNIPSNLKGDVSIDFNAYAIMDQMIVYAGTKELFNTNCTSGRHKFNFSKQDLDDHQKIEIKIKAKCASDSGTAWDIRVNCEIEENNRVNQKKTPCISPVIELVRLLELMIEKFYPIQKYYWMNTICYEKYDKILKKDMLAPITYLDPSKKTIF